MAWFYFVKLGWSVQLQRSLGNVQSSGISLSCTFMYLGLSVFPAGELGKTVGVGDELGITLITAKCFWDVVMKGTLGASKWVFCSNGLFIVCLMRMASLGGLCVLFPGGQRGELRYRPQLTTKAALAIW